jgi:hypothetical protein
MGHAPVGLLEDGWNSLGRHDNNAVDVADDEVAGVDGHTSESDRDAELAGGILASAADAVVTGEDREVEGAQPVTVADPAVDDEPEDAALLRGDSEDLTPVPVGGGVDVGDQDVTWRGRDDGPVKSEVVATEPAHGVGEPGDGGAGPAGADRGVDGELGHRTAARPSSPIAGRGLVQGGSGVATCGRVGSRPGGCPLGHGLSWSASEAVWSRW